jgi:pyrroloquinoline quinone (PQQ) biosynthesis protein C
MLLTSPHAQCAWLDDGSFTVETPDAWLTYGPGEAALAAAVLERGRKPLVLEQMGTAGDFELLRAIIEPALEEGALRDVSDIFAAPTSTAQLEAYYTLCDEWAGEIFHGAFWTNVLSGDASTALMLGWCEQFYHRTVGADEHNAIAVEHCSIPDVADELRTHFSQEVGHGEIFLKGLESAGVPRSDVLGRPPLPSTRALLDFFNELARIDTLAYLACYGVLHSPREGQTLEAVKAQFEALTIAYPQAAPAIRCVGQHAEIDVRAGHDQIVMEPYLLARPPLTQDEVVRVLSSVRGTVAVFINFFAGILAAYGTKH